MNLPSLVIVISGPSGVGKDVIIEKLQTYNNNYHFVITSTTRKIRKGEIEGVNHFFVSVNKFKEMINNKLFLEWANVYGNYYGVEKKQINNALIKGKHVIVRVDVQGAERIRNIIKNSIQIFILPPSIEILKTRLKKRGVNNMKDMELRLKKAQFEISKVSEFNYSIINYENKLNETAETINEIIKKESKNDQSQ